MTRRFTEVKGPKPVGPLGSLTKGGDLLLTVWVENKAWSVRVQRLCVFLATGLLYESVIHVDKIKVNNKWDNLVPVGKPLSEDGSSIELSEEEQANAELEYRMRKESAQETKKSELEEMEMQLSKEVEERRLAKERVKKEKELAKEALRKPPKVEKPKEPFVDYAENMRKAGEANRAVRQEMYREPFMVAQEEILSRYELELKDDRYLNGIHSHISWMDAKEFLQDCIRLDGIEAEEFYKLHKAPDSLADAPKWMQDRLFVSKLSYWLATNIGDVRGIQIGLDNYLWEGQPYLKEFNKLSVEKQAAQDAEIRALETLMGTSEALLREKYFPPVKKELAVPEGSSVSPAQEVASVTGEE